MALGHDLELANVVDSLPGDQGAKHPFGHAVVMGAMEDGPGSSDGSYAEQAGGNLAADSGTDEGLGDGIVFAATPLIEHARGNSIGGDLGRKSSEFKLGLARHGGFREVYFLSKGDAKQNW